MNETRCAFIYTKSYTFEVIVFKFLIQLNLYWSYSVVVITIGFDPINPRSNRGRTYVVKNFMVYNRFDS